MQTLGLAIPQQHISNARNKFNIKHRKVSANDTNVGGGSGVNGSIQPSAMIDYAANKNDDNFASPSAAVEENIIN